MAVFVDRHTRVLVQGATGHQGRYHVRALQEFGTRVVAGVTPGKGGGEVEGVPVYDTVEESLEQKPTASLCLVPAPSARDAVMEALDAGISTVVVVTDGMPVHDGMDCIHYARCQGARIIGPNGPGVASPGKAKVAIIPNRVFLPGDVGVVSRSGTLTYEIVNALTERHLGQSTVVGLGGDPVVGTTYVEALEAFQRDGKTRAVVLVGEIGGEAEEEAAAYIRRHLTKPVYTYIAGRSAPPHRRMGHAGALISGGTGTAQSKIEALEAAGVTVARFPHQIADLVAADRAA
ncbi:MAG: succinate--CoA ligase subunit alpha [Thermoplasmatota archaeon]